MSPAGVAAASHEDAEPGTVSSTASLRFKKCAGITPAPASLISTIELLESPAGSEARVGVAAEHDMSETFGGGLLLLDGECERGSTPGSLESNNHHGCIAFAAPGMLRYFYQRRLCDVRRPKVKS
jgi:hypothetical protein